MSGYQVVVKRIVSPDGRIVAEAKSIAKASANGDSKIIQNVSVTTSGDGSSSCSVKSVSSSHSQSTSIS